MRLDTKTALSRLLAAHARYYTINADSPAAPFSAEADFQVHDERYFLSRIATYAESNERELVFFAEEGTLSKEKLEAFVDAAWREGMERVRPGENHKRTDVLLYILADRVTEEAAAAAKKVYLSKTYRFGLHGYSHIKLAVQDLAEDKIYINRMGDQLRKVLEGTLKKS